ncbi:proline-rich protein 18-like [Empidonax traillii]|uniref:proline-rich protein 18-like n=1 Tax=Empidonax traillii TaxID=164674 RepID=UPI000FFD64BC|nr:proline-rich protein 18-like [Empidonax traillii]
MAPPLQPCARHVVDSPPTRIPGEPCRPAPPVATPLVGSRAQRFVATPLPGMTAATPHGPPCRHGGCPSRQSGPASGPPLLAQALPSRALARPPRQPPPLRRFRRRAPSQGPRPALLWVRCCSQRPDRLVAPGGSGRGRRGRRGARTGATAHGHSSTAGAVRLATRSSGRFHAAPSSSNIAPLLLAGTATAAQPPARSTGHGPCTPPAEAARKVAMREEEKAPRPAFGMGKMAPPMLQRGPHVSAKLQWLGNSKSVPFHQSHNSRHAPYSRDPRIRENSVQKGTIFVRVSGTPPPAFHMQFKQWVQVICGETHYRA